MNLPIAENVLVNSTSTRQPARQRNALVESTFLFRSIFESSSDSLLLADDDGWVFHANAAAARISGATREELATKHVSQILPLGREDWKQLLKGAGMRGDGALLRPNGSNVEIEFEAKMSVVAGAHLIVLRDITGRRERSQEMARLYESARHELSLREKAEGELKSLNHELEQRIQERTSALRESHSQLEAFCYSVSHDLRAPLRSMQGFSHALIEDHSAELSEQGKDFARRILGAAEHMDGLLSDVLAYSRLSRQEFKAEPVPVSAVVEDVLAQLTGEIRTRRAKIFPDCGEHCVLAHRSALELMLVNLLENAMKFVPKGAAPEVKIGIEARGGTKRIWVRDNGIGIAVEHQQRIFRIFERLHGVESYPGTGIGLALVQKAAERMNGAVGVDSAPGKGSSFWIELPAAN